MRKKRQRQPEKKARPMTFEDVRALALALPKVDEGTSYGTPAFKVAGKLLARLHQDGESLVVKIDPDERTMRMTIDPDTFYITPTTISLTPGSSLDSRASIPAISAICSRMHGA